MIIAAVLAQAPASDVISGGAGWVGTGLLGSVLAWLFFKHLPAKDQQNADLIKSQNTIVAGLIESRDKLVKELTTGFREALVEMERRATDVDRERREDYRISLGMVVGHCEKEMAATGGNIRQALDEMSRTVADWRAFMKEMRELKQGGSP